MAKVILIRLHPVKPTTGPEFTHYLKNLVLTVYDISFGDLNGKQIGTAWYDEDHPEQGTIVQHDGTEHAVATAVIKINEIDWPEYATIDLALRAHRGPAAIVDRSINYNVAIADDDLADNYTTSGNVAFYLALPDPQRDPAPNAAYVDVPPDGSPPKFHELKAAVVAVLEKDPGDTTTLTRLTPAQCRHIAREIAWNRQRDPLPSPSKPLEDLYTADSSDDESTRIERDRFEAELLRYYAMHDVAAEQLSRFIFSLSAALSCEQKSADADRAGLRFPVRPAVVESSEKIKEADIILMNS
ncbi:hypothetical protein WMF30_32415 [Sorangium sp. So ce134]